MGAQELNLLLNAYPPELWAFFGGDQFTLNTAAGFLQMEGFDWLIPLVFSFFAAGIGARAIAGEEEENTIDFLLATPLSRKLLVLEKALAMLVCLSCLGVVLIAGLILGYFFQMKISFDNILAVSVSAVLIGFLFGTIALAVGAGTGSRGLSMGIMSGLAIGSYLLYSLGALVDNLEKWKWLSPFFYYSGNDPLVNGLKLGHVLILVSLSVIAITKAVFVFKNRDISVR